MCLQVRERLQKSRSPVAQCDGESVMCFVAGRRPHLGRDEALAEDVDPGLRERSDADDAAADQPRGVLVQHGLAERRDVAAREADLALQRLACAGGRAQIYYFRIK
jgi:hypothetical protein